VVVSSTSDRVDRAALELFAEKGFAATGIRELAERAGVSGAALYHYMGTKEDLLVRVMNRGTFRLLHVAERALEDAASPAERLGRLVALHVYCHAHAPLEALVLDNELRALSDVNRRAVVASRDDYERLWRDALVDGRREGTFRLEELGVARLALLEMCNGVARWYSPGGPLDDMTLCETFVDVAFGAVDAHGEHGRLSHRDIRLPDVRELYEEATAEAASR
jgi:AcrR family transcriptional regulator